MPRTNDADVLIIGAGAAGLAASLALVQAGLRVIVIEARDRVGGRVWTVHDSGSGAPIELGAEFVHGRPQEIFDLVEGAELPIHEVSGERWCSRGGKLGLCPNLYEQFESVFKRMKSDGPDRSFQKFLDSEATDLPEDIRRLTLEYIEGFEAAKPDEIGVQSLVRENKKSEEIDADRAFRLAAGYDGLLRTLTLGLESNYPKILLKTVVRAVHWHRGSVEVATEERTFCAPRVLVTLPLAVLQAGIVTFEPALAGKQEPLSRLAMGAVVRVVLRFNERFWEEIGVDGRSLANMSFLHSDDPHFPTWWTTMPRVTPILTGWSGGPHALQLTAKSDEEIVDCAVSSLAKLLKTDAKQVRQSVAASYFHNWQTDPFSRGAYSYAKVGGVEAARELAQSVDGTLFFAGEATNFEGRQGTVDGAIASGQRAAKEILESIKKQ